MGQFLKNLSKLSLGNFISELNVQPILIKVIAINSGKWKFAKYIFSIVQNVLIVTRSIRSLDFK